MAVMAASCLVNVAVGQVTIVQVGDTRSGADAMSPAQTLAVSWTQSSPFSNVSVYATISGDASSFTAYLMNQIGPTATVANQIATGSFNGPVSNGTELNLFNGLSLPAGTYYLVLSGTNATLGWVYDSTPAVTLASGVTNNGDLVSFDTSPAYPPSRNFATGSNPYLFRVTGFAVPEPSSVISFLGGSAVLAILARRHRRGLQ